MRNKERSSNIELLRVLLMLVIPIYHVILYNGVVFEKNSPNAVLSMLIAVGSAIPADYAFMSISAWFLQISPNKKYIYKWMILCFQIATMYLIRFGVLRGIFGFHNEKYFIDFFLMKGAWWYIYAYMVMLLIYPWLNVLIKKCNTKILVIISIVLFGCVIFNSIVKVSKPTFLYDMIAFLCSYFVIAILLRKKEAVLRKENRKIYLFIFIILYLLMAITGIYFLKSGQFHIGNDGLDIIRWYIGRYNPIGFAMGISLFLLFMCLPLKNNKKINWLSKSTFYVFLLHETWLGIYWYFERCWSDLLVGNHLYFMGIILSFVISSFVVATIVRVLYEATLEKVFVKFVDYIYKKFKIDKIEGFLEFYEGKNK